MASGEPDVVMALRLALLSLEAAKSNDKEAVSVARRALANFEKHGLNYSEYDERRFPKESANVTHLKVLADYLAEQGKLELLPQELLDAVDKAKERWRSVELAEDINVHGRPRVWLAFEGLESHAVDRSRAQALFNALVALAQEIEARAMAERLPLGDEQLVFHPIGADPNVLGVAVGDSVPAQDGKGGHMVEMQVGRTTVRPTECLHLRIQSDVFFDGAGPERCLDCGAERDTFTI